MARHRWLLLLCGIISLLVISPIPEIYDRRDDVITPLTAGVLLAVTYGMVEKQLTLLALTSLILAWFFISVLTDGSGLFTGAGYSVFAPITFMLILLIIFVLLSRWLIRAVYIDREVLCAAVCGYLMLGVLWTGLYRAITIASPHALVVPDNLDSTPSLSDLLYFSYTTLTTTGFGDILPKDPVVRMLSVMEAIAGTFYNTIIIARFVGLYGMKAPVVVSPVPGDDNL
jgi:hypothetical protein